MFCACYACEQPVCKKATNERNTADYYPVIILTVVLEGCWDVYYKGGGGQVLHRAFFPGLISHRVHFAQISTSKKGVWEFVHIIPDQKLYPRLGTVSRLAPPSGPKKDPHRQERAGMASKRQNKQKGAGKGKM